MSKLLENSELMRNTIVRKYDPDIHPETIKMAEYIRGKKQMVLNEVCDRIEVLLY